MATFNNEFDAGDLAKRFTLTIRVKRVKQWQWRLFLASLLCRLAAKVAWLDFNLVQEKPLEPWLYYCEKCNREIASYRPEFARYLVVGCPHCRYQSLVIGGEAGPERITEDTLDIYVCECHFTEPYGFVPEADCPVHDRG